MLSCCKIYYAIKENLGTTGFGLFFPLPNKFFVYPFVTQSHMLYLESSHAHLSLRFRGS